MSRAEISQSGKGRATLAPVDETAGFGSCPLHGRRGLAQKPFAQNALTFLSSK